MTIQYSPSTRGFYDSDLHGTAMPEDVVYVAPSRHLELMEAQAAGASIAPSEDTGNPVIMAPAAPSLPDRQAVYCRAVRDEAAKRTDAVMPMTRQLALLRDHVLNGTAIDQASQEAFAAADAVQTAADTIAAEVEACADTAQLEAIAVRDNHHWPERN